MFASLVVDSPLRGSEFFERTAILSSEEVQVSVVVVIGRSLPTDPIG